MGRHAVALFVILLICLISISGCSRPPEGSAEWYFDEAFDLANKGKYEEAIEAYTEVIESNHTRSLTIQAYINRAAAYANLQDYDAVISDSTKVIELDSDLALAYINRAYAYNAQGEYDLAVEDSTKAIDINAGLAEAYVNRAYAYIGIRSLYLAVVDCNQAIEIDPNLAQAYYLRGLANKALDRLDYALEDFEKFIILTNNPEWSDKAAQEIEEIEEAKESKESAEAASLESEQSETE